MLNLVTLTGNLRPKTLASNLNNFIRQFFLDRLLEQLPKAGAAILLAHEPDFADVVATTHRFDLALSGHVHGGQVAIPFWGLPVTPPTVNDIPGVDIKFKI